MAQMRWGLQDVTDRDAATTSRFLVQLHAQVTDALTRAQTAEQELTGTRQELPAKLAAQADDGDIIDNRCTWPTLQLH